jgi:hypothetical protein
MNTATKTIPSTLVAALTALLLAASQVTAAPPDLTAGGAPDNTRTINLGPTGMRGWVYHVNGGGRSADTSESRQILVTAVDSGSPADGLLAKDDVILGATGTGVNLQAFTSDARKSLALAIAEAEARDPAKLKLLRWRAGATTTVNITLSTMGAYSATAPYNCPKSSQILTKGAKSVFDDESSGRYSFGGLALLATGNSAYATRVRDEARARVPNATTRTQMMANTRDATSMVTWERGHTLVFLAEYYLATGDANVLLGIEAYAVNIAKNSSMFGTLGHMFADKNPDGSPNGPMGGVYGPVNSSGMTCFLGLLLARKCGITHPSIEPAIVRASRFFASYTGRGAIPYGEHEPHPAHESNGKSGLAALCFALEDHRSAARDFYAKMAAAAPSEREIGHTGAFFNYLWSPLGAAVGGEAAAALHFSRIRWMLDLNRRWNGKFAYDCLNGEGPNSGSTYNDFRMSTAALLVYALPLRKLHLTGRGHDPAGTLSTRDLADADAADSYTTAGRSITELIADTGNWSPKIRRTAAIQLGLNKASVTTTQRNQLHAIASDTALPDYVRAGACDALGRIANSASATVLADLLSDSRNYVRYAAAEALRYLPNTDRQSQLTKILTAAASNARPVTPFDEEDPLHFDHGRLAMLLFYGGNAYGPKGILWNNITGVNRSLLYPAIRAVAANPVGQARSTIASVYPMLTHAETLAVSGAIIDSVREFAPADRMFAFSVRQKGFDLLEKFNITEGVPAGLKYMVETRASDRTAALNTLERYAASYTTVTPKPDVIGAVTAFLNATDGNEEENASVSQAARDVLDAIAADTNPRTLVPLKAIQSVVADHPQLAPRANTTVLRVTSHDHAQGDSVFTWKKLSGPGEVTFAPNGTSAAATSTVQFAGAWGTYQFEVTLSDSRGLTEAYGTVSVEWSEPPAPPLKVFILAGQSNMQGHGEISPVTTQGTLEYITANNPAVYGHLKDGANWAVRDDVWIWYKREGTSLFKGGISAGYGASATTIGPELQFGHVMGNLNDGPILIIKTAWGGKSLAVDFRPPSSGWSVNPPTAVGQQGYYYQEMLNHVNDVLTNLPTYFPEYNAANGYELAGFGWHQGWNDRVTQSYNDEYEVNMANFINDVRASLGKPGLPFVIATTGMSGWSETNPRALSLMNAQLAMENFTKYPAFEGNVAVIDTRDFYREPAVSPANQSYHWNRNAETYFLIGQAMAQELAVLITGSGGLKTITLDSVLDISLRYVAGSTKTFTFDATASDKLVVIGTGEHHTPGGLTGRIKTVTYDGVDLIKAVEQLPSISTLQTSSSLWYLDDPAAATAAGNTNDPDPATPGTIKMTVEGNGANYVQTAFALSGTRNGFEGGSAIAIGTPAVDLAVSSPNSLVVSWLTLGGSGKTANTAETILPNSPAAAFPFGSKRQSTNLAGHALAHSSELTPGVATFSLDTSLTDVLCLAAEFLAADAPVVANPYTTWLATFPGLSDPDPALDFDNGGLATALEWVLGGDPADPSDDKGLAPTFDNSDPDKFVFSFKRRDGAQADANTSIALQYSTSLAPESWVAATAGVDGVTIDDTNVPEAGFQTVAVLIPKALALDGKLFVRLKVAIAARNLPSSGGP